jgi:hypothetical protein
MSRVIVEPVQVMFPGTVTTITTPAVVTRVIFVAPAQVTFPGVGVMLVLRPSAEPVHVTAPAFMLTLVFSPTA